MSKKVFWKFGLIFLVSFIISVIVERTFHVSFTSLKSFINSFGNFAPLVYSLVLYSGLSVPFNPIPDFLVVNLAALLFSPVSAVLATLLAHVLALSTNYWLARNFADDVLLKFLSKEEFEKIEKTSKKVRLQWVFGFRFLLPVTAIGIDVVSYAAGLAKLDFGKFLLASLAPWTFYSVLFFFSTSYLKSINPLLFFLPIILILGVPMLYLAIKQKQTFWIKAKGLLKLK